MTITSYATLDAYFNVANYLGDLADAARDKGDAAHAAALDEAAAYHADVYAGYARNARGLFGPR